MKGNAKKKNRLVALVLACVIVFGTVPSSVANAAGFSESGHPRHVQTDIQRDAGYELKSNEIIVTTEEELNNAIKNTAYDTIYFGAHITKTSVVDLPKRTRLIIDGTNPLTGERFTYTDINSSDDGQVGFRFYGVNTVTPEVTFRNMDINIRNHYGIIRGHNDDTGYVTHIIFDNVKGFGTQFIHNYGIGSRWTIRDSELTTEAVSGRSGPGEFAEISAVTLAGEVKLVRGDGTTGNEAFFLVCNGDGITVEDGAGVYIDLTRNTNKDAGFMYLSGSKAKLAIGNDVRFRLIGNRTILRNAVTMSEFTVGERSDVRILLDRNQNDALRGIVANSVAIQEGAVFHILTRGNSNNRLLYSTNGLGLNNPKEVVLGGSASIVPATQTFKGKDLKSIRYYTGTEAYDFDSLNFLANHTDSLTKWWYQKENGIDISANSWGTAASGVPAISPAYAPPDADMITATLGTNFGLGTAKLAVIHGNYAAQPEINTIIEGDLVISGTGEPGASVYVTLPYPNRHEVLETTADSDGGWQVAVREDIYLEPSTSDNDTKVIVRQQVNLFGLPGGISKDLYEPVLAKNMKLLGDNEHKIYYGANSDADLLKVRFTGNGEPVSLLQDAEYVLLSHEEAAAVDDFEDGGVFGVFYEEAEPDRKGTVASFTNELSHEISVTGIRSNSVVWMKAELQIADRNITVFDHFVYNNLYYNYPVYITGYDSSVEGRILDGYNHVELQASTNPAGDPYNKDNQGKYGLPLDVDGSVLPAERLTFGYDEIELKILPRFAHHWTAEVKYPGSGVSSVVLEMDQAFLTDNEWCGDTPDEYSMHLTRNSDFWAAANVHYTDEHNLVVTVGGDGQEEPGQSGETLLVPLDVDANGQTKNSSTNFKYYGGFYMPPADEMHQPVGYYVHNTYDFSKNIEVTRGWDEDFDPRINDITNQQVYISYETGQVLITEKYQHKETQREVANAASQYIPGDGSVGYTSPAKSINELVPVGYRIDFADGSHLDKPFRFEDYLDTNPDAPADIDQRKLIVAELTGQMLSENPGPVTITFYYKDDRTGTGIPDDEEGAFLVQWWGYTLNNQYPAYLQENQVRYSRIGYDLKITNDNKSGDDAHKIVITSNSSIYKGTWLFDHDAVQGINPDNTPVREVVATEEPQTLTFLYAFASDGVTPDNRQYVVTTYALLSENGEAPLPDAQDSVTYVLKGKTFEKTPSQIDNYVYVGYRIDDGANQYTYQNGQAPKNVTFITKNNIHTITLLYRQQAEEAEIQWKGTTLAENEITLNTRVYTGYIGELYTVRHTDYNVGGSWVLNNEDSFTIQFKENETEGFAFRYREDIERASITVKYVSTDGQIDFTMSTTFFTSDGPQTFSAFPLNGYDVTGFTVKDSHGNLIGEDDGETPDRAVVDPAKGDQTLVFTYVPNVMEIRVLLQDHSSGERIDTIVYRNAAVGKPYSVVAPAVEGRYLVDENGNPSSAMTYTIDPVTEGTTTVIFYYKELGAGAFLVQREAVFAGDELQEDAGDVIGYYGIADVSPGTVISAPDLSAAHYDEVEGYNSVTVREEEQVYTVYYTKQTNNIRIIGVDADGSEIYNELLTGEGRLGEMYTAYAPAIAWYTLADDHAKLAYIDPAKDEIVITFAYQADEVGTIHVYYYYLEGEEERILSEAIVKAVVGSDFSANALILTDRGFMLDASEENEKTIVVANEEETGSINVIKFLYADARVEFKANYHIYNTDSKEYGYSHSASHKAVIDEELVFAPEQIADHALVGYRLAGGEFQKAPIGLTTILIEIAAAGLEIDLYYQPISEIISEHTVDIEITGVDKETDKILYKYTRTVLKNSGELEVEAFPQDGYRLVSESPQIITVGEDNEEVTFEYESLATAVTVRMVDTDGDDAADSYTVNAQTGTAMTVYAPNVANYYLTGAAEQSITPVADAGENVLTFEYAKIDSKVTLVAKERMGEGEEAFERFVRIFEVDTDQLEIGWDTLVEVPEIESYSRVADQVTINWDGVSTKQVDVFYTRDMADVTIHYVDNVTGEAVAASTMEQVRGGEAASFTAIPVEGYQLVSDLTITIVAEAGSEVTFRYRSLAEDEVNVMLIDDADGTLIDTYALSGVVNEELTAKAPVKQGWTLVSAGTVTVTVGEGKDIEFRYAADLVTVTTYLKTTTGSDLGSEVEELRKGASYTARAPHIAGYVVEGDSEQRFLNINSNQEVTFTYRPIEEVIPGYTVTVTVLGENEDGDELYKDSKQHARNSGSLEQTAITLPGHVLTGIEIDGVRQGGASVEDQKAYLDVAEEDIEVRFIYQSLTSGVTIRLVDTDSRDLLDSFKEDAQTGKPFTFRAPDLDGYYLVSESTIGVVEEVEADGSSVITFEYRELAGDIILVAKELDGGVIRLIPAETGEAGAATIEIAAPDLSGDYFTYAGYEFDPDDRDGILEIDYTPGEGQLIEVYYEKELVLLTITAREKTAEGTILKAQDDDVRKGEIAVANAPAISKYNLISETPEIQIALDDLEVTFLYEPQSTEGGSGGNGGGGNSKSNATLTVIGMNEDGKELYKETSTKTVGAVVTVEARSISGYTLDGESPQKITIASDSSYNIVTYKYKAEEFAGQTEAHKAYMHGYEDGSFRPENSLTRAEAAMILFQLLDSADKNDVVTHNPYGDVPQGEWFTQAVLYLSSKNIFAGYEDGTFRPDEFITRAEMAAVYARFFAMEDNASHPFADVRAGHWAEAYIANAYVKGWISGYEDGSFRPENNIRRSEATSMVNRILNRKTHKEDIPSYAKNYSDVTASHWAYETIIEASNDHESLRQEDGYETWLRSTIEDGAAETGLTL